MVTLAEAKNTLIATTKLGEFKKISMQKTKSTTINVTLFKFMR